MLGTTKKLAKNELDDSISKLNNLVENQSFKGAKNKVDDIAKKMSNVDDMVSPSTVNEFKNAQSNFKYVTQKNEHLLKRRSEQGTMKNLFDRESAGAVKEVKKANKQVDNLNSKLNNEKSKIEYDLTGQLNQAKADMGLEADKLGVTDAQDKVNEAQKAFDKATRSTRKARMTVGLGALGGGAILSKAGKNSNNERQYDLNNNYI